jgi:hypothetical protein
VDGRLTALCAKHAYIEKNPKSVTVFARILSPTNGNYLFAVGFSPAVKLREKLSATMRDLHPPSPLSDGARFIQTISPQVKGADTRNERKILSEMVRAAPMSTLKISLRDQVNL